MQQRLHVDRLTATGDLGKLKPVRSNGRFIELALVRRVEQLSFDSKVDATSFDFLLDQRFKLGLMFGIKIAVNVGLEETVVDRFDFGHNTDLIILGGGLSMTGHAE